MQVESVRKNNKTGEWELSPALEGLNTTAEMKDYTNKITGLPDPMIIFGPARWIHLSTLQHLGRRVRNTATGEIIEVPNLSPNGWGM